MRALNVVGVEHYKCDSYAKTDYFVAPDGRTEEQIAVDVGAAESAYFAARSAFEALTPKPDPWIAWADALTDPRNGITDDMTIADAKARRDRLAEEHKVWREARDAASGSFASHLSALGYRSLWKASEDGDIAKTSADWGHRHGEGLPFA